jgi:hypothetical protein
MLRHNDQTPYSQPTSPCHKPSFFFTSFLFHLFKTQNPRAILAGAALAGLGVISLFDHYLWTLAPGRLMLGLVTGLFVGQDTGHDA